MIHWRKPDLKTRAPFTTTTHFKWKKKNVLSRKLYQKSFAFNVESEAMSSSMQITTTLKKTQVAWNVVSDVCVCKETAGICAQGGIYFQQEQLLCNTVIWTNNNFSLLFQVTLNYETTISKKNLDSSSWHPGGQRCYCQSTRSCADKLFFANSRLPMFSQTCAFPCFHWDIVGRVIFKQFILKGSNKWHHTTKHANILLFFFFTFIWKQCHVNWSSCRWETFKPNL